MARAPHVWLGGRWDQAVIPWDESAEHHVRKVLRLRNGAAVTYTNGRGVVGAGVLDADGVVRGTERTVERLQPDLTLAVAPPRSADRARMVVEKLAELGVDRLGWLSTVRGEGRQPRAERAQAWARGALEQSRGAWMLEFVDVGAATGPWPSNLQVVVCDPAGAAPSAVLRRDQPILGLVGPEGGFVPDEIPAGAETVSLGASVLRIETAAIAFAALVRAPVPA